MAENSSRIVSIHSAPCENTTCPHEPVCYHKARNKCADFKDLHIYRLLAIAHEYKVYEALCRSYIDESYLDLVRSNPNYNITVASNQINLDLLSSLPTNQIQITCHTLKDLFLYQEYQKLFLIKDEDSYSMFKLIESDTRFQKVHFCIDANFLDKTRMFKIIRIHSSCKQHSITLDSCLTNWIVNGRCTYKDNYIDINYDRTFRRCPFDPIGLDIEEKTIKEMFDIQIHHKCKYIELFSKGVSNNGGTETNIT